MSRNKRTDQKKIIAELEKTPIIEIACQRAGVPRSTVYRWRGEDPDFAQECVDAIESGNYRINDLAESKLISLINQPKLPAITYWLNNHHETYKRKYRETSRERRSRYNDPMPEEFKPAELEDIYRRGDAILKAMDDEEIPPELLQDSIIG